jgi:hypothetical protein
MAEGDLVEAVLGRVAVDIAAAQARAQGTVGFSLRDLFHDYGVGITPFDGMRDSAREQPLAHGAVIPARLTLVERVGEDLEAAARAQAQLVEQREQGVGILAAGEADQDAVAALDHVVVGDGLAQIVQQLAFDLFRVHTDFPG